MSGENLDSDKPHTLKERRNAFLPLYGDVWKVQWKKRKGKNICESTCCQAAEKQLLSQIFGVISVRYHMCWGSTLSQRKDRWQIVFYGESTCVGSEARYAHIAWKRFFLFSWMHCSSQKMTMERFWRNIKTNKNTTSSLSAGNVIVKLAINGIQLKQIFKNKTRQTDLEPDFGCIQGERAQVGDAGGRPRSQQLDGKPWLVDSLGRRGGVPLGGRRADEPGINLKGVNL